MIVLDTHALLWWKTGDKRLSARAARAIDEADIVGVPDVCCFEVALIVERGRFRLDRPLRQWLDDALSGPGLELLPLTPAIAYAAMGVLRTLDRSDPFDAIIAATALAHSAPLVTRDMRLSNLKVIETIW